MNLFVFRHLCAGRLSRGVTEDNSVDSGRALPLLLTGEFEVVIMIAVVTKEMHGSDCVPDLQ